MAEDKGTNNTVVAANRVKMWIGHIGILGLFPGK